MLLGIQAAWSEEEPATPIKVGVTLALSGDFETLGNDSLNGIQMWVNDLNSRGALLGRKVELVYYDDESDPEKSAELYEKLISEDKVDLLLGPYSSSITLAAAAVAERHDFPMVATGAASGEIWSQGYRNIFQIEAPADQYMNLPMEFAGEAGLTRVAIVYADTDFPREVTKGVHALADAKGMTVVYEKAYPQDSLDFGGIVQEIRAASPDIVIGGTYLDDSIALTRALKQAQVPTRMIALTVGPAQPAFGEALGNDADGILGSVAWMPDARLPMAADFSFRYKQRFGEEAGVHVAFGYGGGQVLEAAVRLAGTLDKDKIRSELSSLRFRSIFGRYRVDEAGAQTDKQVYVMQWQNGERQLVLPRSVANASIEVAAQ